MGTTTFFVIAGFVAAVGGIIYWYGKTVGNGVFNAAFHDPHDRKKVFIFSGVVIAVALVAILGLAIAGIIKL